jgi:hypothetical protein
LTSIEYYPGYSQLQVQDNLTWKVIDSISNSYPAILTTVIYSYYVAGMKVGFNIPTAFGMTQLNGLNVQILAVNGMQLTLDLNTTNFNVFAYPNPLPSAYTFPTVFRTSSGPYLPPQPLPYGNQDSFEGTIYNAGEI